MEPFQGSPDEGGSVFPGWLRDPGLCYGIPSGFLSVHPFRNPFRIRLCPSFPHSGRKTGELLNRRTGELLNRRTGELLNRRTGELLNRRTGELLN
jgi:hypothetical protein